MPVDIELHHDPLADLAAPQPLSGGSDLAMSDGAFVATVFGATVLGIALAIGLPLAAGYLTKKHFFCD